ncbi:2-hydroxyacyl-CoA dehydratase [Heliorestis acidaminivorans]|uniref:2-hydroxyacyl-CoA dehydratase n=1 Tax=Heliorestis acidaminivorans TaxID=553427 RepID=A0A6I0ETT5_9FIRM|nr:2-hydroxyacyl-CoA dehydratase [Heliorestis acidaminivorans]KAB2952580.1 2-hydroxyacyl-CoA dehydratase [Heliorestis acidaminivorans]
MSKKVGITTTIPAEIVYAAGWRPIDLNNIFIAGENPSQAVDKAEQAGFPRNICGWIKGLYTTLLESPEIEQVIAVTQGDCSNTHALMETWQCAGRTVIPFAYPYDGDYDLLKLQMEKLIKALNTDWDSVYLWKQKLDRIRAKAHKLDQLTWEKGTIDGKTNHLALVGCSDFNGDPDSYDLYLDELLASSEGQEQKGSVRLGYVGVPPITLDFYDYVKEQGGQIVFNEVQRQFAMPFDEQDVVKQYQKYTYPYSIFHRLQDMECEIKRRKIDGIIHYTQSFCFRQIEDLILRQKLDVPLLTLEGDRPGLLDARSRMRLDAFIDMLSY